MNRLLLLLLASFFILPSVRAEGPYLAPGAIHVRALLSGPPDADSPEAAADFRELNRLQRIRTDAECARATAATTGKFEDQFRTPLAPLSAEEIGEVSPFLNEILEEITPALREAKTIWKRPRPYLADQTKGLNPCVPRSTSFSYPSGDAATGELYARILSRLHPDRKRAIRARGVQLGTDRVLGGAHYPTDVRDGRKLGDRIFSLLEKNPTFRERLRVFRALPR